MLPFSGWSPHSNEQTPVKLRGQWGGEGGIPLIVITTATDEPSLACHAWVNAWWKMPTLLFQILAYCTVVPWTLFHIRPLRGAAFLCVLLLPLCSQLMRLVQLSSTSAGQMPETARFLEGNSSPSPWQRPAGGSTLEAAQVCPARSGSGQQHSTSERCREALPSPGCSAGSLLCSVHW